MIHIIHEAVCWDSRALFSFLFFLLATMAPLSQNATLKNLVFGKKPSVPLSHTKHDEWYYYRSYYRNTSKKMQMKPNKLVAIISQIQDRFVV